MKDSIEHTHEYEVSFLFAIASVYHQSAFVCGGC